MGRLPSRVGRGLGMLAGLVLLAGTAANATPIELPPLVPGEAEPQEGEYDSTIDPPREVQPIETYNDLLARVSAVVPQFGGAWVEGDAIADQDEVLHIYLTELDEEAAEESQRLLVEIFGDRFDQEEVVLHEADYSWDQLLAWFYAVSEQRMEHRSGFGIREQINRVVVQVTDLRLFEMLDGDALNAVRETSNIPVEAIVVEEVGEFELLLRNERRPLTGGTRIERARAWWDIGNRPFCSIAFPANWGSPPPGGHHGFVTASHCSRHPGQWDGLPYWQPNKPAFSGGGAVGWEMIDPAYSSTLPGCPPDHVCRYSDSNFVGADAGIGVVQGGVAWFEQNNNLNAQWNTGLRWRVVGWRIPALNMQITKVGHTSGQTTGVVTDTCWVAETREDEIQVAGQRVAYLCQGLATMALFPGGALPGDSGGAVFRVTQFPGPRDVEALGIIIGAYRLGETLTMAFSAIDLTKHELGAGNQDLLRLCNVNFGC